MPLEAPLKPLEERVTALNSAYQHHSATDVLRRALTDPQVGRLAMVSAFGAESIALLHMVALIDRSTPVIFLDTELLFPETLAYQQEVAKRLRLTDVRVIRPSRDDLLAEDNESVLHVHDQDACCDLRKIRPLETALEGFDGWITGRKRYQGGTRAELPFFEADRGRIKVNPLAHWESAATQDYITENRLPRHPLVTQGFRSIGCWPCTSRVGAGEDDRAGRWRDSDKTECGIHFIDGNAVRTPRPAF